MGDESEWLKLPADEKCVHKAWKARLAGYEEATKLFNQITDERSPEFSKYLGLVKKFVIDNNAVAQEKGLDAVLAFVENAHAAGKTAGEVCSGVITKCLNSARTKTREKGLEILMMYIEIEKQETVMDELLKGLGNKQPKVVAGCVVAIRTAIRDFGVKVILVKPVVKSLQKLLEDRDKTVREETKVLTVEIYRWIGAAIKPQLSSLKPVQLTELEAEFEKLPSGKAIQSRFLRSQQDLKAKLEQEAAAAGAEGGEEEGGDDGEPAVVVDPFDLMDPVEILSKLPKDFYDKIEEKKWQERREALEAVQKLVESPKLEAGDYADLVRALKKVVAKDSNIMLVTLAAKILCSLASGLRKKFSSYAVSCLESLLEKFREKKVNVVNTLKEAVDAVYKTTSLEAISETVIEMMGHKTPSVKAETVAFLARCFTQCTMSILTKKLLKLFCVPLCKLTADTTPAVREASFEALGTAMKVVGEKPMGPFLSDMDNIKMGKIKECCEKAEVVGKGGGGGGSGGGAGARPKTAPPPKEEPKPKAAPGPSKPAAKKPGPSDRPKTAPAKGAAGGAKGKKKGGDKGKKGSDKSETQEAILSDEAVEEKAAEALPGGALQELTSSNWKQRLAAMEKFIENVKRMGKEDIPCQAFVRTICKKPGLKDTNFQVLKLRVELIGHLASNSVFTKQSANFCLSDLVDKIGDVKNGAAVQEALLNIAEACSLEFVSHQVICSAFEQKNPKNQSEALNWLNKAVREFGFKVNVKAMIDSIKKALGATNPAVRTAAVGLLGTMYMYMGAPLRMLFDGEKPALLQQIDAEFEKVQGEKPPAPTRGVVATQESPEEEEEDDNGDEGMNVADLVPRTDISGKITDALIEQMADKKWKERGEALQQVTNILNEAKFITPNIGSLPESLKLRLGDSNKNLVNTTLTICQTLATAMGPNIKQHVRIVGPGILAVLGDGKPAVRANAVTTLNAWVEQGGLHVFVEAELLNEALLKENPNLRTELLKWLAEKLPNCKKLPQELNLCIPLLFTCLEDRNAEVRKASQDALVPFMIHTTFETMAKKAGKLKPASKDQVLTLLDKARANLPAKPAKVPKAAPAQKAAPAKKPVQEEPEEEDEPPAAPPPKATGGAKGKVKGGAAKKAPAPSSKKKKDEEDTSPPIVAGNGKDQRFKDERQLKVLKWNFTDPRQEFVDQLHKQMEPTFSKGFMEFLFHKDFKFHSKAIETLGKVLESDKQATVSNLDLILKWFTLRFFETNPSVLIKALEYLQAVFEMLNQEEYHFHDLEASSFLPYLIIKVGESKDIVRREVRTIFKLICKVYPASKMFNYLLDGLRTKNSKQRTECLEELGCFIEVYGINVCQPSPAQALKIIAQQISDRDNSVRSAALNTVVAAFMILGEGLYKYIGQLKDKDHAMLEERIKRSLKSGAKPGAKPGSASPEEKPKVAKAAPAKPAMQELETVAPPPQPKPAAKCPYSLDLDDDDDEEMSNAISNIDLIQHKNLDLDEPIKLPELKCKKAWPVSLVESSTDAKSAIELVISQIASPDIATSIQALAQIDVVLKDSEKADLVGAHVDQFLLSAALQLRMVYNKHMGGENTPRAELLRLYQCLMGAIQAMVQCKELLKSASTDVLKDLIYYLLTIMLDNRLSELADGDAVVRSVNVIIVKIMRKGEPTTIYSALIKLLYDCVGVETCSPKFMDIVMKCLWKLIKILPSVLNDLNLDRILGELHNFFKAYPTNTWKSRPSDTPLKTIKTLLFSLAKQKGKKILSHTSLIDTPNKSEVVAYLNRILTGNKGEGEGTPSSKKDSGDTEAIDSPGIMPNLDSSLVKSESTDTTDQENKEGARKKMSTMYTETLTVIFKKIGVKDTTKEGLKDLYEFKLSHPNADIQPFLKKSSPFFQNYIERGLKALEKEREDQQQKGSQSATVPSTVGFNPQKINAMYRERLMVLRARAGLDNTHLQNSDAPSENKPNEITVPVQKEETVAISTSEEDAVPMLNRPSREPTNGGKSSSWEDMEELRRRLEALKKKSANS